ncbi:MAG: tetratricopeptide repeat protein [Steroidobacteraceae bacterium]
MATKFRKNPKAKAAAHPALAQLSGRLQQALAFQQHGELARAQFLYEKILKVQPCNYDALNRLGVIALQTNNPRKAVRLFEKAIDVDPGNAVAHGNRGLALHQLQQLDAALASYGQALAINPGQVDALLNRGNVLKDLQQWDAALASYDRAIEIKSDYAEAYSNSGFVLKELKQLDAALARFNRAIAIRPGYASAYWNRALTLLLRGDFENGWLDYEWRRKLDRGSPFHQPLWLGQAPLAGKTILLHSEQGLGDTLQFCRYVKLVADLGARVILEVQKPLMSLLAGLDGVSKVIAKGNALPNVDYQCPLMSLPLAFKTSLDTIPFSKGYLSASPAKLAHWRNRLGERTKARVGLVWSGSKTNYNDRNRSIPLKDLIQCLPADLHYFCLQKDIRESDRQTLNENRNIADFGDEQADFSDAAALCEGMDAVISVDTSVAHLSGALGVETHVLLPFNADWRWLQDRSDSPWYSAVKLYRQSSMSDWSGVFSQVKRDLVRLSGRHSEE